MAALFYITFNRYQQSNHMIFFIEQIRSQEQALQAALYAELQSIRALIRNPDVAQAQRVQQNTNRVRGLIEELKRMEGTLSTQLEELNFPQQKLLYFARFQDDLDRLDSAFSEIHAALIARSDGGGLDAAALSDRFESGLENWAREMNVAWNHDIGQAFTHIQQEKKRTTFVLLGLVVINVAVSLLLSIVLVTSVRRLLGRLAAGVSRVSSGDYDHPVESCRDPEMNDLVENFNRMTGKLKQLEEMRCDFISMLTHDMKSPLTVIKMYAGMLLEKGTEDSRPVQTISRSADRMLHLVENFLDFTKSEGVSLQLDLQPVSLAELVSRVVEDCDLLARSRGVGLASSLPPALPQVMADEGKIERVLHNLVTNAIKYNQPGGKVVIQARRDGQRMHIEVEDTGMGISGSDRDRLFVKYSRAERTRHIEGTGLGLVASREIVRAHGGELDFASREGEGTVFFFDLQIAGRKEGPPSRTRPAEVPSSP